MANAYYDYNSGSAGNDGLTPATAKATRSQAVSVAGAGDKVIAVDGVHVHEATHFTFDDDRIESADSYRGATLQANTAETARAARTSGSLTAANNPHTVENLVFDGQSGNGGAGVAQAFDFTQDAAEDLILQQHGCEYIAGNNYGALNSMRRGRQELVNCKLGGSPSSALLDTTANLSNDGNQTMDLQGTELDGSASSGTITGIKITKVNNLTNTLDVSVKGTRGKLTATGTASAVGINVKSVDPIVANSNLEIDSEESSGSGNFGILCQGQSIAVATNPILSNNEITFNAKAGYGIALGQSDVAANVTGGEASGNKVKGKFFQPNTPHGFLMGQALSGATCRGNTAQDIYVGFLASKCTSGTLEGNLAFDCYGPSYYVKGTTALTLRDNIAVVSGKHGLPDDGRGVLSVAPQGATNTTAATIQENLVIVQDISKIHSLGYVQDINQACSFVRNTYVIPDTVDVDTADLFSYHNGAGGAANNTLAEWNAQTEVTNDVIVQLPSSEIYSLIESHRPTAIPELGIMQPIMASGY